MAARVGYRNAVRSRTTTETAEAAPRPWSARRRRPPPPRCWAPVVRQPAVARWEKDFCESNGVPWEKVTDPGTGLNGEGPGGGVALWDDSGAVEALLAARRRYRAAVGGGGDAPPLPDPDMYIDAVADGGEVVEEEEGYYAEVEAEYAAAVRDMERAREECCRLRAAVLRDDFVPVPTGWDA